MPDIKSIAAKLQNNALTDLKLYPQDPACNINTLLDDILSKTWNDLSNGALAQDEIEECEQTYAKALITNLRDDQAIADIDLLFTSCLSKYIAGQPDSVYAAQLFRAHHLQPPSSKTVYIASDVSTAAKAYATSNGDPAVKGALLANIVAFYNNAAALYVLMDDEVEFDTFKTLANNQLKAANAKEIPPECTLAGKTFDGLILRGDYKLVDPSNDPNTEARIISAIITKIYPMCAVPTKTVEAILPTTVVFFNAKKLARATISELLAAKTDIGKMMTLDRSRLLAFSQMANLQMLTKQLAKMQTLQNQLDNVLAKSGLKSIGKFKIEQINMASVKRKLMQIEKKMKNLDVSRNPKYHEFDTYQRPNRREPMNPDLPGTSMDLGYYPDIHLYVDTSGSISEKDYEDSVSMIIDIAKKLNCDIYFNSFTTDISQETVVRCRDRSAAQIKHDIEKIPKLDGGTTIDQVWQYINCSSKNKRQLSVLISDFQVDIPRYIPHPRNLYYIPTKDTSPSYAEKFATRLPDPYRVLF